MTHSILAGAIFVAIVLAPWFIALISGTGDTDPTTEPNIFEEGFI